MNYVYFISVKEMPNRVLYKGISREGLFRDEKGNNIIFLELNAFINL